MGAVIGVLAGSALLFGVIGWFVGKLPWSSEGGARGFALGLLLGPIGVLVAAVLRSGDMAAGRSSAPPPRRSVGPRMSTEDLVARGLEPLSALDAAAKPKPRSNGLVSLPAAELRRGDEILVEGRFRRIISVNVGDREVHVDHVVGTTTLAVDEVTRAHRDASG